jgi:hypothetical protein
VQVRAEETPSNVEEEAGGDLEAADAAAEAEAVAAGWGDAWDIEVDVAGGGGDVHIGDVGEEELVRE